MPSESANTFRRITSQHASSNRATSNRAASNRATVLIDGNNFYASCEAVVDPSVLNRPLVVLSNNDGCIVSRSAEARALGIPMGAPYFKVRAELDAHGRRGSTMERVLIPPALPTEETVRLA